MVCFIRQYLSVPCSPISENLGQSSKHRTLKPYNRHSQGAPVLSGFGPI